MNGYFKKTAIAALCGVTIGLGGCGSGSDSATTSTITTTPSLGQISNATVTIYQADGSTVLGSGEIGVDGAVNINFSGYSGAVVIEVAGDADAQYFDEASGALVNFPVGQKLHAIAPTASGSFVVSILTELAYSCTIIPPFGKGGARGDLVVFHALANPPHSPFFKGGSGFVTPQQSCVDAYA